MKDDAFPADLVPLSYYDKRVDKFKESLGVDYRAIQKAIESKKITRFQRGSRVYVSKSAADAIVCSSKSSSGSVKCRSSRYEVEHEQRIAALEREMADLRQQLGIQ